MKLSGFSIPILQACYSLLYKMKAAGIVDIDYAMLKIEQYIDDHARVRKMKENRRRYGWQRAKVVDVTCSACSGPAYVERVNTGPRDQTGDDTRTAIICYNTRGCGHIDWSTNDLDQYPVKWVLAKHDRKKVVRFKDAS